MPRPKVETTPSESSRKLGLERILFFSDAVMAIAITLLVIDLKLPDIPAALAASELPLELGRLAPRIISFVVSFAVISLYWSSHHRYFSYVKLYDGRLIFLNLVFLLFIVLMPFAASLEGAYGYLPFVAIVYGVDVAATGFSIGAIWWYASHEHRLVDPGLDAKFISHRSRVALIVPLLFLASLPIAFLNTTITQAIWWVAPFVTVLAARAPGSAAQRQS